MSKHLSNAIDKLKRMLLALSAQVDEAVHLSVKAIETRDTDLADRVIESDDAIDQAEIDVEEECLKILALHQPVAVDLRFIVAVLKINNDLERIGDLAVNMAERARVLAKGELPDWSDRFNVMAEKTQRMLKQSMDALVNFDSGLAYEVCTADDEVDQINREIYDHVKGDMRKNPDGVSLLIHILSASRHLERIADLATNIAEDVIYMISGEIVRHSIEDYKK